MNFNKLKIKKSRKIHIKLILSVFILVLMFFVLFYGVYITSAIQIIEPIKGCYPPITEEGEPADDFQCPGGSGYDHSPQTEGDYFYSIPPSYYYSTSSDFDYYPFGNYDEILPYAGGPNVPPPPPPDSFDTENYVIDVSLYSLGLAYPLRGEDGFYVGVSTSSQPQQ